MQHIHRPRLEDGPLTFEALYERYSASIFRFIFRRLRDRADAEDVTSETFISAMHRFDELKKTETISVNAWIFKIARNKCIDHIRQRRTVELPSEFSQMAHEERNVTQQRVVEAVTELCVTQREPLILCDVENMSCREAGVFLGISEQALKSRLYKARKALREALAA